MKHHLIGLAGALTLVLAAVTLIVDSQRSVALAQGSTTPVSGSWTVDPAHTLCSFAITHLGLSIVRGRFDETSGAVVADSLHPDRSSVQFTIQTASIDTNVKMRDDDLRSAHFFDTAQFPQITFQSTSVHRLRHADRDGANYTAVGQLTMHGVTHEVTLPFVLNGPIKDPWGSNRIGVTSHLHLLRSDYNIAPDEAGIGNDVDVNLSLEATQPLPK